MIIKSLLLRDYKPFQSINIEQIFIQDISNILLLIGDNGSSKSSVLRELTPFPAKKNSYGKNGYKEIHIEHNRNSYQLISDFTDKFHTHAFYKNGEDLNGNGLISTQEELVLLEFGYSSFIHELVTQQKLFCEMTKSDRKDYIYTVNLFDLSLFISLHKKTLGKIRDCKSNLKLLYSRKEEMESKLLDKSIVDKQMIEHKEYIEYKSQLEKVIFTIEQYLTSLNAQICNYSNTTDVDTSKIKTLCKNVKMYLMDNWNVDTDIEVSSSEISRLDTEISQLEFIDLAELAITIDKYNDKLNELNTSEQLSENDLEFKINTLIEEYTRLTTNNRYAKFDDISMVSKITESIAIVSKILSSMQGYQIVKLVSKDRLNKIISRIQKTHLQISRCDTAITLEEYERNKLKTELLNYIKFIQPNEECKSCELYTLNEQIVTSLKSKIEKIEIQLHNFESRMVDLKKRKSILQEYISIHIPYIDAYSEIESIFNMYNLYSEEYTNKSLKHMFLNSPMRILAILDIIRTNTENTVRRIAISQDLKQLEQSLASAKEKSETSKDLIVNLLKDKESQYATVYSKFLSLKSYRDKLNAIYIAKEKRIDILNKLNNFNSRIKQLIEKSEISALIEYYNDAKKYCKDMWGITDIILREIETILKEQTSISDRLVNEIEPLIKKILIDKELYEDMEKGLSPTNGIPHSYLVNSINQYIKTINVFISHLSTKSIKILPILDDREIDFIFPVKIDDTVIPDVSVCSSGQRCIINIACTIATIVSKGYQNYPLYLDEFEAPLDSANKQKFLVLLKMLIDNNVISQLYMISHHATMFDGFTNSDIIAFKSDNVIVPSNTNEKLTIN